MSRSASQYPISHFIARVLEDSGFRRSEFISSLGYRSVQGGLRRLDEWLDQGRGDSGILDRIAAAYHVDTSDLEKALAATEDLKAAEAKAAELARLKDRRDRFQQYL